MKKTLKFLSVFMVLLTVFSSTTFAKETANHSKKIPTIGIAAENLTIGYGFTSDNPLDDPSKNIFDTVFKLVRSGPSSNIITGENQISKISSGKIKVVCETEADKSINKIGYTVTYEMYDNGSWVSMGSVSNSKRNDFSISGTHIKKVEKDKYYRVKTTHYIIDNGVKTTKTATSEYIYVD